MANRSQRRTTKTMPGRPYYEVSSLGAGLQFWGNSMIRSACAVATLLLVCGCGINGFEDSHRLSSEEIKSLIDKAPYPNLTAPTEPKSPGRIVPKPDGTRKITINLVEAIRLALATNQGFLSSTEGLDLQLLSLEATRRSW